MHLPVKEDCIPSTEEMLSMDDAVVASLITKHGQRFCDRIELVKTETPGHFRLTDVRRSWFVVFTLREMVTSDGGGPLEWARETFSRFDACYRRLMGGIPPPDKY